MENYYLLGMKYESGTASAFTQNDITLDSIPEIISRGELSFELNLRRIEYDESGIKSSIDLSGLKHIWLDLQPNSLTWNLMSERMRSIVDDCLTGFEGVKWIKVLVEGGGQEKRTYFVPSFERKLDVLNEEKTTFVNVKDIRQVIKPVFSFDKIKNYSLFHRPQPFWWQIPSGIYINDIVKMAIEDAGLTGVKFEKTSVE